MEQRVRVARAKLIASPNVLITEIMDKKIDINTMLNWKPNYRGMVAESIGRVALLQLLEDEQNIIELTWPDIKQDYDGFEKEHIDAVSRPMRILTSHGDIQAYEGIGEDSWMPDETYSVTIARNNWWAVNAEIHLEVKFATSRVRDNQLKVMQELVDKTIQSEETNRIILLCEIDVTDEEDAFELEMYKLVKQNQRFDWNRLNLT